MELDGQAEALHQNSNCLLQIGVSKDMDSSGDISHTNELQQQIRRNGYMFNLFVPTANIRNHLFIFHK